jgi:hypothetical protein
MMFTILEDVFLHAGGSYMGYKFCGNVEGGEVNNMAASQ